MGGGGGRTGRESEFKSLGGGEWTGMLGEWVKSFKVKNRRSHHIFSSVSVNCILRDLKGVRL